MFFSSLELSETVSLHLSGISRKPLFIWLSGTFEQFWYMPPIPKDRCFFWVWSCQKPTLYIFLESLMSRVLYDFQALLIYAFQFRKIDVFSSLELSKTDSLHLSGISRKPCFIWLSGTFEQFWYMPPIPKDGWFHRVWSCPKPTLYIFLESLKSRLLYDL